MRALIIATPTRIAPFNERPAESMLLFGSVGQALRANLRACRIRTVDEDLSAARAAGAERVLVLADRCYASHKVLHNFLRLAKEQASRLALRRTPSVDYLRPVSDVQSQALAPAEYELRAGRLARLEREACERVAHDIFVLPGGEIPSGLDGEALLAALRERCPPLVVPKRELALPLRLPVLGDAEAQTLQFPITSSLVAELRHWVHVLWLNQLQLGEYWMSRLRRRPLWMLWRALSSLPSPRRRLMQRLVVKGRRCRIHPTAHVELSVLGDDVVIGPHASVRNSFVGSGSHIGDHATLLSSVVGPSAFITTKTFLVWSVIYPGATVGNYKLQVSLVGRDAHLNVWAGLVDAKFKGAVRVQRDGQLYSTERSFLGSCVGHRAVLAAKVLLQPGRAVPNDAVVVMRPDEVIAEVPQDLPAGEPLVRHQGTLVPLQQLLDAAQSSPTSS